MTAVLMAGCAQPVHSPGAPLDNLHACPAAGRVIGVFTGQGPTEDVTDGPASEGFNTWALELNGTVRQLTHDDVHMGAVIAPDARTVYQLRSSGRLLADALETPGIVERLDVATGEATTFAQLPGSVDLTVSDDGRWVAVAHTVESHPDTGLDVNSITVIDTLSPTASTTLARAPEALPNLFSVVTEVALSPDGGRLAYVLSVEVQRGTVVNSLHMRDLQTGADTVLYTPEGTDFVSDVAWPPEGATVVAAIRHQDAEDPVEAPARFRSVHVDLASGRTTLHESYSQELSPVSVDGNRLLGLAPGAAGDPQSRALIAWDRHRGVSNPLPIDHAAAGISVASCSYR
jgi:hypothetical protein